MKTIVIQWECNLCGATETSATGVFPQGWIMGVDLEALDDPDGPPESSHVCARCVGEGAGAEAVLNTAGK